MAHISNTGPSTAIQRDLAMLDELLDLLGAAKASATSEQTPYPLLEEHIHSARSYKLGAMPREYQLSLEMASDRVGSIQDEDTRNKVQQGLEQLIDSSLKA